jgi:hypothetical protein
MKYSVRFSRRNRDNETTSLSYEVDSFAVSFWIKTGIHYVIKTE